MKTIVVIIALTVSSIRVHALIVMMVFGGKIVRILVRIPIVETVPDLLVPALTVSMDILAINASTGTKIV